jgi:hypothetical protein
MARKSRSKTPVAQEDLASKVKKYLRARAIGKKCYARADRILEEITAECRPGQEIPLNDSGRKAVVVDPFEKKFVAFRPLGFRRYELVIVEG